jgi:hypothetical protein
MLSVFNWLVIFGFFISVYSFTVFWRWRIDRKWNFRISSWSIYYSLALSFLLVLISDEAASKYVEKNVNHSWEEKVFQVWKIEDVKMNREKEGSYFIGIGSEKEKEVYRYSVINPDGSRTRDLLHASNAKIVACKKDEVSRVEEIRRVRVYKDKGDENFFKNIDDRSSVYYKIYL